MLDTRREAFEADPGTGAGRAALDGEAPLGGVVGRAWDFCFCFFVGDPSEWFAGGEFITSPRGERLGLGLSGESSPSVSSPKLAIGDGRGARSKRSRILRLLEG